MLTLMILSVISPIRIFLCYKKYMALKLSFISAKLWKMLIQRTSVRSSMLLVESVQFVKTLTQYQPNIYINLLLFFNIFSSFDIYIGHSYSPLLIDMLFRLIILEFSTRSGYWVQLLLQKCYIFMVAIIITARLQ